MFKLKIKPKPILVALFVLIGMALSFFSTISISKKGKNLEGYRVMVEG